MFTQSQWESLKAKGLFKQFGTYSDYLATILSKEEIKKQDYLEWKETLEPEEKKQYNFIFNE